MAAALDLGSSAERRASSSLALSTNINQTAVALLLKRIAAVFVFTSSDVAAPAANSTFTVNFDILFPKPFMRESVNDMYRKALAI